MINYIKFLSAVSINIISTSFTYCYVNIKFNNFEYQEKLLPYILKLFVSLNPFIFIMPLAIILIGLYLLKKELKFMEAYWHLCIVISFLIPLLCIISWEIPYMLVLQKP